MAEKMGVPYLIKMLNANFIQKIKECLPDVRSNLLEQLKQREFDLKQLGQAPV
jgi:hypothetical protein